MDKPVGEHQVDPEEIMGPGHPGTHPRAVPLPEIESVCPFSVAQSSAPCPASRPVFHPSISAFPSLCPLSEVRRNMPSSLSPFWPQFAVLNRHLLFKTKDVPYFQLPAPWCPQGSCPGASDHLSATSFSVLRTGKRAMCRLPDLLVSLSQPQCWPLTCSIAFPAPLAWLHVLQVSGTSFPLSHLSKLQDISSPDFSNYAKGH